MANALTFKYLLLVLAVINIFIAFLFLVMPKIFIKINDITKKWIETNKIDQALNNKHDIDSTILKAQKVLGLISLILCILLLTYYFALKI